YYKAAEQGIYLSLGTIKGVGYQSVKAIVDERYQNGRYKDFFDFTRRLSGRVKTRKLLEALILVGAFDQFGETRATLLGTLDEVLDSSSQVEQDALIFDFVTPKLEYQQKEELPDLALSNFEKEYLGFYITKHPMEKLFDSKQFLGIYKLNNANNHQPVLVQMDTLRRIRTKKGQPMAFATLNDGEHTLDGVIFPDTFQRYETLLLEEKPFIVKGKFENRNQKHQLIINEIQDLDAYEKMMFEKATRIILRKINVDDLDFDNETSETHQQLPIYFYDEQSNQMRQVGRIERDVDTIERLVEQIDPENIRLM
ncbi:MAG: OB-fold nucleic acid binding domain-containing protein, partial [Staphylococcus simulans]|nr:OB-fold nucleic acid binding domain-containing protein [Staphylococcus simulans]